MLPLGRKQTLADAGTTREAVMGAPLSVVKNVGRERTVAYAQATARELGQLPAFPERDGLVAKLTRRATAHEETAAAVDAASARIETELRSPLGVLCSQLRVDVVKLHGRLTARFPKPFVESLFPRSQRKGRAGEGGAGEGGDEAGGDA